MSDLVYVDTSALAKYYVPEAGSDIFQDYLQGLDEPHTGRLTLVEFRCLTARRARAGTLDWSERNRMVSLFLSHVSQGLWRVIPFDDNDLLDAAQLVEDRLSTPLRTLDALHVAAARRCGATTLATADHALAEAATATGLTVERF